MTPVFSIILAITLAISAFLIFELIYNLRRQKKAERLLSAFEKTAAEFGLSISKRDITGNRVIGFDDINNKLLFVQLTGNKEDGYLIDLEEVSSARVSRTYTPFWNGWTKSGSLVQTIGLQIEYKNGARPLLLPFYDNTTDPVFELREKSELAIRWQDLLSTGLDKPGIATEKHASTEAPGAEWVLVA